MGKRKRDQELDISQPGPCLPNMIHIEFADQQEAVPVDKERLAKAVRSILEAHGPETVRVSIAVVDDSTIHELNRRFLRHDYPTDVLSFVLEEDAKHLEGEVVMSAETARAQAERLGVRPEDELLLYLIHGVLHLVGFDDATDQQRVLMRRAEEKYLSQCGTSRGRPEAGNNRS